MRLGLGLGYFNGAKKRSAFPTAGLQVIVYDQTYEDGGTTYFRTSLGIGLPVISGTELDAIIDFEPLNDVRFDKSNATYWGATIGDWFYYDPLNPYHGKLKDFHYRYLENQIESESNTIFAKLIYEDEVLQRVDRILIYESALASNNLSKAQYYIDIILSNDNYYYSKEWGLYRNINPDFWANIDNSLLIEDVGIFKIYDYKGKIFANQNITTSQPAKVVDGIDFDGNNDYLEIPIKLNLANNFTIAYTITTFATSGIIIGAYDNLGADAGFYFGYLTGGYFLVSIFVDNNFLQLRFIDDLINDGNPHSIIIRKSGNTANDITLLLDGENAGSILFNQPIIGRLVPYNIFIGARNRYGTADFFADCTLDDVMIVNSALTDNQLLEIYEYVKKKIIFNIWDDNENWDDNEKIT